MQTQTHKEVVVEMVETADTMEGTEVPIMEEVVDAVVVAAEADLGIHTA